jgi:hypothetical protein
MASTASTDVPESDSGVGESAMEDEVASSESFIGRIYRISAPGCDRVYVGSTRKTLSARMGAHKRDMRRWQRSTSKYMTSFALVGLPGASIDIIEEDEYADMQHMRDREAYWIARLPSVNRQTPGRSRAESARISSNVQVPCGICGKLVRRNGHTNHRRTRACMLVAFNRRENALGS